MKRFRIEPKTVRRDKFSLDLVRDAQAVFAERLGRPVSEGEARNLLANLTDYMWILIHWKTRQAEEAAVKPEPVPVVGKKKRRKSLPPKRNPKPDASRTK